MADQGKNEAVAVSAVREEMEKGPPIRMGVTDPISLNLPTAAELALTEHLLDELRKVSPLDTEEGNRERRRILLLLHKVLAEWVYEMGIQQGMDEETARTAGCKIFTFGSYRLGLVNPGSDIDALAVTPKHMTREAFFTVLVEKLQEHPEISEITPVPDAYVPIIKMKFAQVEMDLLFVRLLQSEISEDLESLNDDDLIKNMDDRSVRSMNGCRVADHILALVPNPENFKHTLRFIKLWAKKRGLYSNVLGFFGGITWAILVARVCQLFPYYCVAALVSRFFRVYDRWNWRNPVLLCPLRESSQVAGLMSFRVWNPKLYPQDRMHLMPVITPAFPSMNSTHNVSETTKKIFLDEFHRAQELVSQVEQSRIPWSDLYKELPFFTQHKYFIHVEILGKSKPVFLKWKGWIESKLRRLVKNLESIHQIEVRPWPDAIEFEDKDWSSAAAMFMGLIVIKSSTGNNASQGQTINLRQQVTQFVEMISQWPSANEHKGLYDVRVRDVRRRDLPEYVKKKLAEKSPAPLAIADAPDARVGEPPMKKLCLGPETRTISLVV